VDDEVNILKTLGKRLGYSGCDVLLTDTGYGWIEKARKLIG